MQQEDIKNFLKDLSNTKVQQAGFLTAYNPRKKHDQSKSSMSSASPLGNISDDSIEDIANRSLEDSSDEEAGTPARRLKGSRFI